MNWPPPGWMPVETRIINETRIPPPPPPMPPPQVPVYRPPPPPVPAFRPPPVTVPPPAYRPPPIPVVPVNFNPGFNPGLAAAQRAALASQVASATNLRAAMFASQQRLPLFAQNAMRRALARDKRSETDTFTSGQPQPGEESLAERLNRGEATPQEALTWFQTHGRPEFTTLPTWDGAKWVFTEPGLFGGAPGAGGAAPGFGGGLFPAPGLIGGVPGSRSPLPPPEERGPDGRTDSEIQADLEKRTGRSYGDLYWGLGLGPIQVTPREVEAELKLRGQLPPEKATSWMDPVMQGILTEHPYMAGRYITEARVGPEAQIEAMRAAAQNAHDLALARGIMQGGSVGRGSASREAMRLTALDSLLAENPVVADAFEQANAAVAEATGPTKQRYSAESLGTIGQTASKSYFRELVAKAIQADPNHPLRNLLVDGRLPQSTRKGLGEQEWLEDPGLLEAGHGTSEHAFKKLWSKEPAAIRLMTAYENRHLSSTVESRSKGAAALASEALDLGGVPVSFATARDLVASGKVSAEAVRAAPVITWSAQR